MIFASKQQIQLKHSLYKNEYSHRLMKTIQYKTQGVCSRMMTITVEKGKIASIDITGGCDGNLQGICSLVIGMNPEDVIHRLEGISCEGKGTSCPDQLAKALKEMVG